MRVNIEFLEEKIESRISTNSDIKTESQEINMINDVINSGSNDIASFYSFFT